MVKSTFGLLIVAVSVMAATPTVRTMYNDAFAREQAIRAALTAGEVPPALINEIRATVARYEAVVRHYPTSSYCDNALWQAAQLSADAFAKFGQAPDKDTALRLLKQLASMYPTSKLAAQVPAQLTRLSAEAPAAPRVVEPPRPTAVDAPPLPSPAPPEKPLKTGKPEPVEKTALTTIKEIRRTVLPDAVRVVIELDGEVEFRQDRIDGPPRVFVDLNSTRATPVLVDKTLRFEGDADVVRQVRVGRHPNNTTRVVLDAAGVSSYSVYPLYGPYRLVIDCVRASGVAATSGVVPVPATVRKLPSATVPMRQLLTESLLLGTLGGLVGLVVAQWSLDAMLALSPVDLGLFGPVKLDYTVLAFTAVVSLFTAVICGFAPAFDGGRTDVQASLRDGTRQVGAGARQRRLRQSFVVAEVALAVVLLVGAGLMLRSFTTLQAVDSGMDTRDVLTLRVALPGRKYTEPAKTLPFFQEATRRIRALPGVRSAGMISYLPFTGLNAGTGFTIVGEPPPPSGQEYVTDVSVCDNGYFQTLRLPLVKGRFFSEREMHEKSDVVVINEALANRHFPNGDAIGKSLVINMTDRDVPTEIIGIVGNSRFVNLQTEIRPTTYWPHPQLAYNSMTLAVRTASAPLTFAPAVEHEILAIDPDQPVSDVRTMDQWIARTLSQARFSSMLMTIFAALALGLAAIGIYGVMSYAVSQRTSEIGIRLALGAERRDILRLIVANGASLAAAGLAIGVALALVLSRTITGLLYETTGTDPLTFVAVVVVLGLVALLACYLPARRASRITPTEALRYQ